MPARTPPAPATTGAGDGLGRRIAAYTPAASALHDAPAWMDGALAAAEVAAAARAAPGTAWDLLAADAMVPHAFALVLADSRSAEIGLCELLELAGQALARLGRRAEEDPA